MRTCDYFMLATLGEPKVPEHALFFMSITKMTVLTMRVFSGRKRQRRCQSLVQRAPTTPLLGQLEHLAAFA